MASEYKSDDELGCCLWNCKALLEHRPIQVHNHVAPVSCSESGPHTIYSPAYLIVYYVAQDSLEHADLLPSAGIIGMSQQARLITYLRTWVWSARITRLNQLQFTRLAAGSWMVWTVLILPPLPMLKCLHKSVLRLFKPKLPLASVIKITNVSREFTELSGLFIRKGRELLSPYLRFFLCKMGLSFHCLCYRMRMAGQANANQPMEHTA